MIFNNTAGGQLRREKDQQLEMMRKKAIYFLFYTI